MSKQKIIQYYQTFDKLDNIQHVTRIIGAALHFGPDYIHLNDHDPDDPRFDQMYGDLESFQRQGGEVHFMLGGAGGAYKAMFQDYDKYYHLLSEFLEDRPFITGLDLDIEESVLMGQIQQLVSNLHQDFPHLKLTMAPVAGELIEDKNNHKEEGEFDHLGFLQNTPQGQFISELNVQMYGCFSYNMFYQIIEHINPERLNVGMISSDISSPSDFARLLDQLHLMADRGVGGCFVWEHYNAPQDWSTQIYEVFCEYQNSNRQFCSVM